MVEWVCVGGCVGVIERMCGWVSLNGRECDEVKCVKKKK